MGSAGDSGRCDKTQILWHLRCPPHARYVPL